MCHIHKNCTAPYVCIDFQCICPPDQQHTGVGCEQQSRGLRDPCLESTPCPAYAECRENRCTCKEGYVELYSRCLKKALQGEECEDAIQCPQRATCDDGVCTCRQGTRTTTTSCVPSKTPKRSLKSLEVYKAAMIVAACLMVVVLLAFLACVIKKSFFDDASPSLPTVFSVAETVPETLYSAYEKPPSYDDVVRHHEDPPSYADVMGACGSSRNPAFVPDV